MLLDFQSLSSPANTANKLGNGCMQSPESNSKLLLRAVLLCTLYSVARGPLEWRRTAVHPVTLRVHCKLGLGVRLTGTRLARQSRIALFDLDARAGQGCIPKPIQSSSGKRQQCSMETPNPAAPDAAAAIAIDAEIGGCFDRCPTRPQAHCLRSRADARLTLQLEHFEGRPRVVGDRLPS